ncbi:MULTISPECIES: hypothetical protein [Burkholderia]|uniref:hypothetical protein n=1 Tax=Burkholderia TaxID=32008 RepID=UPI0015826C79|nr:MULTISPECIES: hypothetical protein [Burkholderia]
MKILHRKNKNDNQFYNLVFMGASVTLFFEKDLNKLTSGMRIYLFEVCRQVKNARPPIPDPTGKRSTGKACFFELALSDKKQGGNQINQKVAAEKQGPSTCHSTSFAPALRGN